jgi:glycogen synthase
VEAAFDLWNAGDEGAAMIRARARGMAKDFSWDGPAAEYAELYASLLRG